MVAEKGQNSEEINNKVKEFDKSMAPEKGYILEEKNATQWKGQQRRQCSGRGNALMLEVITEVYYQHDVVPRQSQQL